MSSRRECEVNVELSWQCKSSDGAIKKRKRKVSQTAMTKCQLYKNRKEK